MQNVEYKCELRELELARAVIRTIGGKFVAVLEQRDTYYKVFEGRLKKRETKGEPPEWILYHRQDRLSSKLSHFRLLSEDEAKARFGDRELPVWVVVNKMRELYLHGSVRLHLDQVEELGNFLEIEALVTPRQHIGRCHRLVKRLLTKFGPVMGEPISCSYSDMIAAEHEMLQRD